MMNIWNLVSQESIGVRYIDGICAKFCLKLWFGSNWYFAVLLKQDGFKCDPEISKQPLHKVSPEAAVCRCSSK